MSLEGAVMHDLEDIVPGEELDWAVQTALAPVDRGTIDLYGLSAEAFVSASVDVISGSLENHGLSTPDRGLLVEAVRAEQHHRALQWIHERILAGGEHLVGDALTDAQWSAIRAAMQAVRVDPPAREAIDTSIRERWR